MKFCSCCIYQVEIKSQEIKMIVTNKQQYMFDTIEQVHLIQESSITAITDLLISKLSQNNTKKIKGA